MTGEDLEFIWLPTFADRPDDFCGWDGAHMFGRVFFSQYGWWHWHLSGRDRAVASGQADSELEAKKMLDAAYRVSLKSRS